MLLYKQKNISQLTLAILSSCNRYWYVAFSVMKLKNCVCRLQLVQSAISDWQMQIWCSVLQIAYANSAAIHRICACFHFKLNVAPLKMHMQINKCKRNCECNFFLNFEIALNFELQMLKCCGFSIALKVVFKVELLKHKYGEILFFEKSCWILKFFSLYSLFFFNCNLRLHFFAHNKNWRWCKFVANFEFADAKRSCVCSFETKRNF